MGAKRIMVLSDYCFLHYNHFNLQENENSNGAQEIFKHRLLPLRSVLLMLMEHRKQDSGSIQTLCGHDKIWWR